MAKDNFVIINARVTFKNIPMHKLAHFAFKDVNVARESFMKIKDVSECVITVSYTHLTLPTILLV